MSSNALIDAEEALNDRDMILATLLDDGIVPGAADVHDVIGIMLRRCEPGAAWRGLSYTVGYLSVAPQTITSDPSPLSTIPWRCTGAKVPANQAERD